MIEYCKQAVKVHGGDIVEIGGGNGDNTIEFLKIAQGNQRKVIVIDPFEDGWNQMPQSYGQPYPYETFKQRTEQYNNWLYLHRYNSLCMTSEKLCKDTWIAFAYVDGLQYKGAVLSDLRIVSHAYIIAVDDYNRSNGQSQVREAVTQYIEQTGRKLIDLDRWAIII